MTHVEYTDITVPVANNWEAAYRYAYLLFGRLLCIHVHDLRQDMLLYCCKLG